jgi:hypothetical protein
MWKKTKMFLIAVSIFFGATISAAQTRKPIETRNAALRYWMAFADLQDPPADKATADLLEKTATGEAAWDETKLGPILDKNQDAILAMQRATKLPECDWGLEYDRGPSASIAYVPRARVLARLNTVYGMRLAANGKAQEAIDTWLAGIRFSQHLTRGGGLIFSLIAKMTLLSNFNVLRRTVQGGGWTSLQQKQVEDAIRTLPKTGFDWSEALWHEQAGLEVGARQIAEAENPRALYEEINGNPAPANFEPPNASDTAAFQKVMAAAESTLRLPPEQAEDRLKALQESVKMLHPFYRDATPSFTHINDARKDVEAARERILGMLSGK